MTSNLSVKVTAETVDLVAKFAIASASATDLRGKLRELAQQSNAGTIDAAGTAQLQQFASDLAHANANVAALKDQMKGMRETSSGFGGSLEEVRAGMSRAFQVTGIAAAAEGVRMFGDAIENLGGRALEMRSMAEVLGVNTSQLQAMQVAAEEAGVEAETLARAEERLTNMLTEARAGSAKAIEQLHELGVSTREIASPTFQLTALLAVLKSRLEDTSSAEQTRKALLQDLGARSAGVIPVLKEMDLSEQGVAAAMRRVNGLSGEQIGTLAKMKASLGEVGTFAENTASKMLALVSQVHAVGALGDAMDIVSASMKASAGPPSGGPGRSASSTGEQAAAEASARQQETLHNEVLKSEIESIKESVSAYQEGSAQKLAALRQLAALEKQYYGSGNVEEVRKANSDVLAAEREYRTTQGSEAIAAAREQATVISGETEKTAIQRLAAEAGVWQKLLDGTKLNTQQRLEAERQLAQNVASIRRDEATESAAIERSNVSTDIALSRMQLAAAKETADAQVAATKQMVAQKYAALKTLTAQEFALDLQALSNELSTLKQLPAEYAKVDNQIRELKEKLVLDLAKLDKDEVDSSNKAAKQESAAWRTSIGEITSAEGTFISDMLGRRKTLAQSLQSIALETAQREISADVEAFTKKKILDQIGASDEKASESGGVLFQAWAENQKAAAAAKSQMAQTGAVETGNTARTASTEAAMTASKGAAALQGGQQVMADAAKAFSGTYASVSSIPVVGWILAPIAAATAFAAVSAYEGMASLDVGTNYVPRDMIAQIHQGEAVIPRQYNPAAQGGAVGAMAGGGDEIHHNYGGNTINVSSTDVKRMLSSRSAQRDVMNTIAGAYRRGVRPR
jgi:hypothetical protein